MDNLFITPINLVQGIAPVGQEGESQKVTGQDGISLFQDIFQNAINDVIAQEDDYAKKEYLLATGQIDDPHTVPIAGAEVQLSIDMLVQIRNKALEAYNSLITMSL